MKSEVRQRWAYAAGNFASMTTGYGIVTLAPYVFNLGLGVDPALIGLALAMPRLVDLFTDPAAGFLSDRLRGRFGRRWFIGCGTLVSAACFAGVWWCLPGWSPHAYFRWLLIFSCGTALGWSILSVPWQALGFELTDSGEERTRLMAAATLVLGLAGIFYGWSYYAWSKFADPVTGSRWVGSAMAVAIVLTGFIPVAFCREPEAVDKGVAPPPADGLAGLGPALRRVLGSRPFLFVAGAVVLMCIGVFAVTNLMPYIGIFYVERGNQALGARLIGASSTVWQGTCLTLSRAVPPIERRLGKRGALIFFLGLALVGNVLKWCCYTPAMPWLYVVPSFFFAAGFTGLWTLAPAMVADVCEYERQRTGADDDGMFAGFYNWMIKLGSTVAFALGGVLINLTGFRAAAGANQGAATILRMRWVDFSFPAVTILLSIILIGRYRLRPGEQP